MRKYCSVWSENLHAQSTKPGENKKPKIIEFRSIIRNIELFEVLRFSKNQRFCRKIGDLKKNTVVFYKGKCSSTDFEELYLRDPAMDFDDF